jgi:D-sedoheptulose 7-phosphate isomerase
LKGPIELKDGYALATVVGNSRDSVMPDSLTAEISEHRAVLEATSQMLAEPFTAALDLFEAGLRSGGKLMLFGNGGSAADAQHIAAELVIRYSRNRESIAAMALTTDSSALTACANDFGFESIFERQVSGLGRAHGVVVGLSTSGKSANVLRGLRQARSMGLNTVGLTGAAGAAGARAGQGTFGGELSELCDVLIAVPSEVTARIQEMHILIGHMWCKALEQRLGLV